MITFKFSWGQWAIQRLQDETILYSPVNYPPIQELPFFDKVLQEFKDHRDFFRVLNRPEATISNVQQIHDLPLSTFSATLRLQTEDLEIWTDSLRFRCPICENIVWTCNCVLVNEDCSSLATKVHSTICPECDVNLTGAHLLNLTFADNTNEKIRVQFTAETIDNFMSFPSKLVVSDPAVYTDFLNTVVWHTKRKRIGRPFLQAVVLRKFEEFGVAKFAFVSGALTPVADGQR